MNNKKYSSDIYYKDDLGREIYNSDGRRENRYVGMFYFLWCDRSQSDMRPMDNTKLICSDKDAGYKPDSPVWGGYSVMHHWGEPLMGYYFTADEWVMRRHVEMLTAADIDFLVFDTTNAVVYEDKAEMMMRLLSEYRAKGFNTPKVVFYTNSASGPTAQRIYDYFYKTNFCSDSWFYVDGKPIIIAVESECSQEVRDFFTIRASQWPNEPTKRNGWPWMDFVRPQRVLENYRGEKEIINVSVAQHPQIFFGDSALYGEDANRGRSFHNGANDKSVGAYKYGYNFAEQWERAIETDPPYVFVTGWNEWIAGRWGGSNPDRPLGFVDCCNLEFSRDIEPMRGGYFDNYYMQLISFVRRYKGNDRKLEAKTGETIGYKGFPNIANVRDCDGYNTHYHNDSGRNCVVEASVTDNGDTLTFTATTEKPITAYDYQSCWMRLLIAIDGCDKPCCCGANYMANVYQFTDSLTSLAVCTENSRTIEADTFAICGQLDYSYSDNNLTIVIPKDKLELEGKEHYTLKFKWVDSKNPVTRYEEFYTDGCTAPVGRLYYVFNK